MALVTGKRLLPDCYVRTADSTSYGNRVYVGFFDDRGLSVRDYWGGVCDRYLGLASEVLIFASGSP
jgi:hypothetical protein